MCIGVMPWEYWGGGGESKHPGKPQAKFQGKNQGIQNERDQRNASWKDCPVYYAAGVGFLATESATVGR